MYLSKKGLKRFSIYKLLNSALLVLSYYLSIWLKKPLNWGLPYSFSVEPNTSCNLRCPECPSGLRSFTRPTGILDVALFKKVIDDVKSHMIYLTLYFQGEPFLHPNFFELVKIASEHMFVATSTNAHYLSYENSVKTIESGLDKIIISIDGTTPKTYQSYRIGGKLSKVLEGTKNIVQAKKDLKVSHPKVVFQYLVVKPNEHQLEEARALAKELEVDDIVFKTAQIYDYENGSPLIPTNEKYSRYKKNEITGKYVLKNSLPNQCWRMWHSCVFTWDGNVVPCCFDKDASHALGSIQEKGFKMIWKGLLYQGFRTKLLKGRKHIDICQNCTEGGQIFTD